MRKMNFFAILATIILFGTACSQAPEAPAALDMDALKAEIQAMENAYAAAENAKDVEGILVYYADDAVNMPANEPVVVGKEAIRQRLMADFAEGDRHGTISFKVESIMAEGDLLVEAGSSIYTSEDGEESMGKYISVFEKRDGKYVCVRDIWNNDKKMDDDDDDDDDDDMEEGEMESAEM